MMRVTGSAVLALGVCLSASPALSQPRTGEEFQVNSYTPGDQGYPAVCRSPSGQTVVTWETAAQDGNERGIFAQRYASDGAALGGEFQVNSHTVDKQQLPSVACGASGFVVAWESYLQDGDGYGVFAQRYDSSGATLGGEFQVNAQTVERQLGSAICLDASGGFVVTWQSYSQDGDGSGVFARRYDSGGAQVGTEFQVNSYTPLAQAFPAAGCAASGSFVVVWHSDGQDGDTYGVFAQRFASDGMRSGTEFQVNSFTAYYQQLPSIAVGEAGGFVVVWESYDYQDGDFSGVFGQLFASSGDRVGTEFQVNTYTSFSQEAPSVATIPGGFVVSWSSGQDGDGYGVFGQQFTNNGTKLGAEFQVNSYTQGDQGAFFALGRVLGVAGSDSGDFVVVWQSTQIGGGQDGYGFGVFGQSFAPATPVPSECIGDIDQNGKVAIDELIRGVLAALERVPTSNATAFDRNGDGTISIDELVAGVGSSVNGC